MQFLHDLLNLLETEKDMYIAGDFNIDFLDSNPHRIVTAILNAGFDQIVQSPTHRKGNLLDHVYIHSESNLHKVHMHFPYYSDHAALVLERNIPDNESRV